MRKSEIFYQKPHTQEVSDSGLFSGFSAGKVYPNTPNLLKSQSKAFLVPGFPDTGFFTCVTLLV